MTGSSARTSSVSERPLPLGENDLHLWFSRQAADVQESDRFKRDVLTRYASAQPQALRFGTGEHGKPRLLNAQVSLDFNISHSGDWLVCAVTAGTPVGIDIEYCDSRRNLLPVARRFFKEHEALDLQSCAQEHRAHRFYEYWTLKEADIKARGQAIGAELEKIGFELSTGAMGSSPWITINRLDSGRPVKDKLYLLLEPAPDYRVASCWPLGEAASRPKLASFELGLDGAVRRMPARLLGASGFVEGQLN